MQLEGGANEVRRSQVGKFEKYLLHALGRRSGRGWDSRLSLTSNPVYFKAIAKDLALQKPIPEQLA